MTISIEAENGEKVVLSDRNVQHMKRVIRAMVTLQDAYSARDEQKIANARASLQDAVGDVVIESQRLEDALNARLKTQ